MAELESAGNQPAPKAQTPSGPKLGGKYLTFKLGSEEYGIGILKVREINGLMEITPVPRMPGTVRGVINLRGKIIPVLDLRCKFNMPSVQDTKQTCIIVIDVKINEVTTMVGILVDTVSEVVNIADNEIDKALNYHTGLFTNFILGAAKIKGSVKILLDIEKIITDEEITTFVKSA